MLLANALCDYIVGNELDHLEKEHMTILILCSSAELSGLNYENWLKIFTKLKDYLFVGICDTELCESSLEVLIRFFTSEQMKFQVYDVSKFSQMYRNLKTSS
jgi:hypothetical protein